MVLPNKLIKEIEKERKNYWGQFDDLKKIDFKNLPPHEWIVDQEPFREFGRAVNWVIKVMKYRQYYLKDIQVISRNDEIERACGSRTKGANMLYFPFELGYSCPICSPPVSHMNISIESISLRLTWSEYKNHMYCKKCNIDIPSFLCADVKTKADVLYYEKFYLEMINEIKQPFLKIIESKSKAYQNLRNRLKRIKEGKPIIRWWCAHWTDRCSLDGSEECLAECFKYCPDCRKCYNKDTVFCLNDQKHPCIHFDFASYPSPLTHSFSCLSFSKGMCLRKNEFCRDVSYEDCPRKIEEKKGVEN